MKVHCTHKKNGCEWEGELDELDGHLNANPTQPHKRLNGAVSSSKSNAFTVLKSSSVVKFRSTKRITAHDDQLSVSTVNSTLPLTKMLSLINGQCVLPT